MSTFSDVRGFAMSTLWGVHSTQYTPTYLIIFWLLLHKNRENTDGSTLLNCYKLHSHTHC